MDVMLVDVQAEGARACVTKDARDSPSSRCSPPSFGLVFLIVPRGAATTPSP